MYTVAPYYLSKIAGEFPVLIFTPMLFTLIVYFGLGLTINASQFFYFYLILFLLTQCAASFGFFISSVFEKEEAAVGLAPVIMMPFILFGGQFANSGHIQAWISWHQYLSPIRYSFEALVINE
jgi:ATP-binding cassette, subfamily G (WHITE), eye pigment precursor transporter